MDTNPLGDPLGCSQHSCVASPPRRLLLPRRAPCRKPTLHLQSDPACPSCLCQRCGVSTFPTCSYSGPCCPLHTSSAFSSALSDPPASASPGPTTVPSPFPREFSLLLLPLTPSSPLPPFLTYSQKCPKVPTAFWFGWNQSSRAAPSDAVLGNPGQRQDRHLQGAAPLHLPSHFPSTRKLKLHPLSLTFDQYVELISQSRSEG